MQRAPLGINTPRILMRQNASATSEGADAVGLALSKLSAFRGGQWCRAQQ